MTKGANVNAVSVDGVTALMIAAARDNAPMVGLLLHTSSIFTRSLDAAMRAANELKFGETYVNREHFEAMQGFHAGWRKSGIGGADGRHGLEEFLQTHVVYMNHNRNAK